MPAPRGFRITGFKVNKTALRRSLGNQIVKSKQMQKEATIIAEKVAEDAKKDLLNNFENHVITKEIDAGPENLNNRSRTLGGAGRGSLFGFIGFSYSDRPMEIVREYLNKEGRITKSPKKRMQGTRITYEYNVKVPHMAGLEALTPMPWEGGRSWIRGIERGISGLGFYIANKAASSRSGQGVQTKGQVRTATYKPTKYISLIINSYLKHLQTGKRQKLKK